MRAADAKVFRPVIAAVSAWSSIMATSNTKRSLFSTTEWTPTKLRRIWGKVLRRSFDTVGASLGCPHRLAPLFVVSGANKRAILARVLANDMTLPAARLATRGTIRVFADRAAAG